MSEKIITSDLIEQVKKKFEKIDWPNLASVAYEIQDDYRFLLITVSMNNPPEKKFHYQLRELAQVINELMPPRKGDYSWMISISLSGKVIDSYFGGNSESPRSGL